MNFQLKNVHKSILSFLLSVIMVLTTILSPIGSFLTPVTVKAADDIKFNEILGTNGNRKKVKTGKGSSASTYKGGTTAQLVEALKKVPNKDIEWTGIWKRVEKDGENYSGDYKKIFDRMHDGHEKYGDVIYCADLRDLAGAANNEYCGTKYHNVQLHDVMGDPIGEKVDIEFRYWHPGATRNTRIEDLNQGASNNATGPLIAAYASKDPKASGVTADATGVMGWNGYKRLRCEVIITDADKNSLSQNITATVGIMDIDAGQGVATNPASAKMIINGTKTKGGHPEGTPEGTIAKAIQWGNNTSDDYAGEWRKFLSEYADDIEDAANLSVYDPHDQRHDYPETSREGALVLDLNFSEGSGIGKNRFSYWYFAGAYNLQGGADDTFGTQSGRVFQYLRSDAGFMPLPDPIEPPLLTKLVNGKTDHVLSNGGEVFEYTLKTPINEPAADTVHSDSVKLSTFSWEDTLVDELEPVAGSVKLTLNGSDVATSKYTTSISGQTVKVTMTNPDDNIEAGDYVVHFQAKIREGKSLAKYMQTSGQYAGYAKIPNFGKVTFKTNQEQEYTEAYGDTEGKPEEKSTVYVYWKPAARPDPTKAVNKTHLTDGDETWHYTVTQTMPADTWPFGYMQKFEIVDQVDDCLTIVPNSVKVNTPGFSIKTDGKRIVATATGNDTANIFAKGTAKNITLEYDVTFNKDYSYRLKSIKPHKGQLTDGAAYDHVDAQEAKVLVKNNATVDIQWDSWGDNWNKKITTPTVSTDVDIPTISVPKKDVSDEDENNVAKDTLTDGDEIWTYKITQKIPEHTASIYRYTSFNIKDQIDECLTIGKDVKSGNANPDDIVVKISGKEMNRTDMAVKVENNLVTVTPSASLLQGGSDNVFYGKNNAGSTITIEIPVHIYSGGNEGGSDASNKAVLEKLRAHNHFNSGDNETTLTFKNKATTTVDDMIDRTPATMDTEEVTTTLNTPQIKAPKKYVSDKDDLNWDHNVEANGENKDLAQNRISDAAREWIYTIEQDVPDHTVPLFYYKSFSFKDKVDTCLEYDPEDAIVTIDGKEYDREYFKVAKDEESNLFTVTATDKALKAADFYGYGGEISSPNKGPKIRVQFPVHIKVDPEHPYDTATLKAHAHLKKDDQGHDVYEFINGDDERETKSIINNLIKDNGNAPDFDDERKVTSSVKTQVEVPEPTIEKSADRFEWEVGEDVKYTITIKNQNPSSIMDKVTVTDVDLPDSLQLNKDKEDAIMVYAEDATRNASAPGNKDSIPNPRGLLTEVEENQITDAAIPWWKEATDNEKQIDNITKQCEVTYYNDQGDTGNGFKVMVPKQYRGETLTITFTCRVTEDYDDCISENTNTCCNGTVVSNTASVFSTNMLEDKEITDEEHIWVNTPHLSIQKYTGAWNYKNGEFTRVDEDENQTNYKPGDKVHYTVLVKNNHKRTLARDVVVTDEILDEGLMLDTNSIEVHKIRLGENGLPVERYNSIGQTRLQDGTDYTMTAYGTRAFEIYFTGRTLRHWGDSPFNESVPANVNNGKYETGAAADSKIPGMKRTGTDEIYAQERDPLKYRDDVAYTVDEKGNALGELADINSLWLKDSAYANTWDQYPVGYQTALENGKASNTMDKWKSIRTVKSHPDEWKNSDTAYIITYEATTTKGISLGKAIHNEVYTDSENSFLAKNSTSVIVDGPKLAINKKSDKDVYPVNSTGKYILEVTQTQNEGIAKNVVIKDSVANTDATIDLNSVKVMYFKNKQDYRLDENYQATGGEDITKECTYPEGANSETGIYINTGRDLDANGIIVVSYDMKFQKESLKGKTVPNTAAAKGDNTSPELVEYTAWSPVTDNISVRKSSDPYSGTVVKQGDTIEYTIGIRNTSGEDLYNVLVKDDIPELSTYVDGSARVTDGGNTAGKAGGYAQLLQLTSSNTEEATDGEAVEAKQNGGTVAAILPTLHANETKYLVFQVTVNEEATDADFIHNVAKVYDASEEEIPKNTKFSNTDPYPENVQELFNADKFALTNETLHPLSNWAVDNNIVRIIGSGENVDKEADKASYIVGETVRYTANYSLTSDDAAVEDVVVVDKLEEPGIVELKGKEAFKVFLNGKDVTSELQDLVFNEEKDGYSFRLGKKFTQTDNLKIVYEGVTTAKGVGRTDGITNTITINNNPATETITITDPDNWLKITKSSDKEVYGLTTQPMLEKKDLTYVAHYNVVVKNDKDGEARNVVITDAFEKEGMKIDPKSIKITLTNEKNPDGLDVTKDVNVIANENNYEIHTGMNLRLNDYFTVTYDVTFLDEALANSDIINVAKAKADNVDEVKTDHKVRVLIPNLDPEKDSDSHYYSVGEKGNYHIHVSQDQKDIKAINVVINDKLSAPIEGFYIVDDSIKVLDKDGNDVTDKVESINVDEDKLGFTINTGMDLEYEEFFDVTYQVDFDSPDLSGTAIQNIVKVKCDNAPEKSAENTVHLPNMDIHKAADPVSGTSVMIPAYDENGKLVLDEEGNPTFTNKEITYTISVKNTSEAPLTNVLVRDAIPQYTKWVEGGEVQTIDEKEYVTFVIDSIEAGETKDVTFKVEVTDNGLNGQKFVRNIAQVKEGGEGDPEWGGDGWNDTNETEHPMPNVVVINDPKLSIDKQSDKKIYELGETGHYTVTVTQTVPNATAKNVIIKDDLEDKGVVINEGTIKVADTEGKDITGDVKITADKLNYYIETGRDLKHNEKFVVTYDVTFESEKIANDTLKNVAKATGENIIPELPDPDEPVVYDGYTVLKSSEPVDGSLVKVGDDIKYTITVTNTSDAELKNILVMDNVPEGTTYVEGGTQATINEKEAVTFVIPSIKAGESEKCEFTVKVNDKAGDSVKNVGLVKPAGENDDPEKPETWNPDTFNPTNEIEHPLKPWVEDDNIVEVIAPVLDIEKESDKKVYNIDETAHYTVKVTNTKENTVAKNIVIKDNFQIEGVSVVKGTIKLFDPEGKDVTNAVDIITEDRGYLIVTGMDLKTNEVFTVTYDAKFTSADLTGKDVVNVAMAKADNASAVTTNDVTPVDTPDGLQILKSSDPESGTKVKAGAEITYNINVKNTSTEDKENILVMDKVPDLTTYVALSGGELATIDGVQYVTFVIPKLEAGKDQTVSFKVTVSDRAKDTDIIQNVALVKVTTDENPDDPTTWKPENFTETNKVEHPLGNWVRTEETVKVTDNKPVLGIEKKSDKSAYMVGDTGHYTVATEQLATGQTAKNVVLEDALQTEGAEIVTNSIKVYKLNAAKEASDESSNKTEETTTEENTDKQEETTTEAASDASKDEATASDDAKEDGTNVLDALINIFSKVSNTEETKENKSTEAGTTEGTDENKASLDIIPTEEELAAGEDVTGKVKVDSTKTGYTITTNMDLEFGERFVVTYDVNFKAATLAGKEVVNVAKAKADNTDPVNVEYTVPVNANKEGEGPKLNIEKTSDKETYKVGETANYTLKITNTTEGSTATNVAVHDEFENKKVQVDRSSIVVKDPNGKTINIKSTNNADTYYGFDIKTGVNLKGGETMTVTYKVKFNDSSLKGKTLKNTAIASADNADPVETQHNVNIPKDTTKDKTTKENPKTKESSKNPSNDGTNKTTGTVKTGDILFMILLAGVAVMAISGGYYYTRKRRTLK